MIFDSYYDGLWRDSKIVRTATYYTDYADKLIKSCDRLCDRQWVEGRSLHVAKTFWRKTNRSEMCINTYHTYIHNSSIDRFRFSFNVKFIQTVHTMFSCTHAYYVSTYLYINMIKLPLILLLNLSIITSYNNVMLGIVCS